MTESVCDTVRGMPDADARLAFRAISGEGAGEVLRKSMRRKELVTMVKVESQLHDLHIVCGIPGSGKSTWAAKQKGTVISTDAIRGELFGDETAQYSDSFLRQNGYDPDAMTEREGRSLLRRGLRGRGGKGIRGDTDGRRLLRCNQHLSGRKEVAAGKHPA